MSGKIDLVAGYAYGYSTEQIRPFLKTLRESGYDKSILFFADGDSADEARRWNADVRACPPIKYKPHADRFLHIEKALNNISCEGILLADTRDVIFQKDLSLLPSKGLHVFEEDRSMTLGSCPYNSDWLKIGYGQDVLNELSSYPISCVGTSCGDYVSVMQYLKYLRIEILRLQPSTGKPQDQAAHNWLLRKSLSQATIWDNEKGEVYTVGYLPRESVSIMNGKIVNRAGEIPTVIHQWDRHENLTALVEQLT